MHLHTCVEGPDIGDQLQLLASSAPRAGGGPLSPAARARRADLLQRVQMLKDFDAAAARELAHAAAAAAAAAETVAEEPASASVPV
jgi:hypothetical protein